MGNIYDIHCHILPGVDDGSPDMETSLKLLDSQLKQGVKGVVLTPHLRHGMFEAPKEKILEAYKRLKEAAAVHFTDMGLPPDAIKLVLGCEVHASAEFENDLKERSYIKMAGYNIALLEFSGAHTKSFISECIYRVRSCGITPILAHVERIPALSGNIEYIERLKNEGIMIQVNADAVLGLDGGSAKKTCKRLLKADLVDFIGSDAHNLSDRPSNIGHCAYKVAKKYGEDTAYRIFKENPEMFFN